MSDVPNGAPPVSAEHRRRRREAYKRAAAAHTRAASVHEEAAAFFVLHDKIDKAAYHRTAAEVERGRAQADQVAGEAV